MKNVAMIYEQNFSFSNYERPMFVINSEKQDLNKFCRSLEGYMKYRDHLSPDSQITYKIIPCYESQDDFFNQVSIEEEKIYKEDCFTKAIFRTSNYK